MPGESESSDPRRGDASPRRNLLIVLVFCLGVVGLLVGGVGFLVHHMIKGPTSPYQVAFSTVGESCDDGSDVKGLVLDRGTGEILYCGVLPGYGADPAGSGGEFSDDETARVLKRAKALASEDGLSEEEQSAVKQLAREIGRKHGYEPPTLAERMTGAAGPYGLGVGLALLVGLGLWGHYTGEA